MKSKVLFVAILFLTISLSFAQEMGKLGLNFSVGSSGSVGITYFVFNKFAIRPSLEFSRTNQDRAFVSFGTDENIVATSDSKRTNIGGSIGGLYYIKRSEPLCSYVGGSVGYTYSASTTPDFDFGGYPTNSFTVTDKEGTQNSYNLDVLLGWEYFLKKGLSIFSEIQFGYTYTDDIAYTSTYYGDTKLEGSEFRLSQLGIGISFYIF